MPIRGTDPVVPSTAGHQHVDMAALMRALPATGLEPACLGVVLGMVDVPEDQRWHEAIDLLEPPAGQHVPYIEPVNALEKICRRQGMALEVAKARALENVAQMRTEVADSAWVSFYDSLNPEVPECLPLPEFVAWLRRQAGLVAIEVLDFFEQVQHVIVTRPMFKDRDNQTDLYSLESLPSLPAAKAMIEFVPGPPWDDFSVDWEEAEGCDFRQWREAMRPIAQMLEASLGEPVYYFKTLGDEIDDDDVHRFLVLHWCCTYKPESAFVRYLLEVSGAKDVGALKAALIDPASYTQPFKMNRAFCGAEVETCRFNYPSTEPLRGH